MKALAIGIHNDDCEYAIGGILALLCEKGWDVTVLNLAPNTHSPTEEDEAQSMQAAKVLGAQKIVFDYTQSEFYRNNEESIEKTKNAIVDIKPDIIFMHYPKDHHSEHVQVAQTTREAIFRAAVAGACPNEIYAMEFGPMQTMCYFNPDIYINIDSVLDKVEASLLSFNLKHASGTGLVREKKVCARFRGYMGAGAESYGEALKIVKYPSKNNDFLLKEVLNDYFRWAGGPMYFPNDELFM